MIAEIIETTAIGYPLIGVLTARRIKFGMENSTDLLNATRDEDFEAAEAAWKRRHADCQNGLQCRLPGGYHACHNNDTKPVKRPIRTYKSDWNALYVGLPIAGGVLWPLAWPIGAAALLWRFGWGRTRRGVAPAVRWLFENPRHRKARKHAAVASGGKVDSSVIVHTVKKENYV